MTPEITSKIIYVAGFISACLFYFAMYVLYTRRKKRTWLEIGKIVVKIFLLFALICYAGALAYALLFNMSYIKAFDLFVRHLSNFAYYIPFLP